MWFEAVTAVALGPDSLTISVPTPFAKEYIETRFKATLEDALRQELSAGRGPARRRRCRRIEQERMGINIILGGFILC